MKRPLSAQHNKTSFGEFHMTKKLYQTPKVSNYRIDGSGRDSYINFNNGGAIRDSNELGVFKYANKSGTNIFNCGKAYNVIPKLSIYKSDGMGRDQYIVRDCGGFYQGGNREINPHNFRSSLRGYDVKPTKVLFNDFSVLSKTHLLKPVKIKVNEIAQKQRVSSARLSVPKRVTYKYTSVK